MVFFFEPVWYYEYRVVDRRTRKEHAENTEREEAFDTAGVCLRKLGRRGCQREVDRRIGAENTKNAEILSRRYGIDTALVCLCKRKTRKLECGLTLKFIDNLFDLTT